MAKASDSKTSARPDWSAKSPSIKPGSEGEGPLALPRSPARKAGPGQGPEVAERHIDPLSLQHLCHSHPRRVSNQA